MSTGSIKRCGKLIFNNEIPYRAKFGSRINKKLYLKEYIYKFQYAPV